MLKEPLKVTRAVLVLAALLGTTAACSATGTNPASDVASGPRYGKVLAHDDAGIIAAPNVAPGQPMPMDIPQGGG